MMNSVESFLGGVFTPEQQAEAKKRRDRDVRSYDAGFAGEPPPEDMAPDAYASGVARRRVKSGEIVGYVYQSCICNRCNSPNYGWRLGCRCWSDNPVSPSEPPATMTYGYQVEEGSDPNDPSSKFMTQERMVELIDQGREVIDVMLGKPVVWADA